MTGKPVSLRGTNDRFGLSIRTTAPGRERLFGALGSSHPWSPRRLLSHGHLPQRAPACTSSENALADEGPSRDDSSHGALDVLVRGVVPCWRSFAGRARTEAGLFRLVFAFGCG